MRWWCLIFGMHFLMHIDVFSSNPQELTLNTQAQKEPIQGMTAQIEAQLSSKAPLPIGPLIPLEPQFPLELTQANERYLIHNPERLDESKKLIKSTLEKHSFPWLTIAALLACGSVGWAFYLMRDRWLKQPVAQGADILTPKQRLDQALLRLQKPPFLDEDRLPSLCGEFASLLLAILQLRLGLKTKEMTTQEIERALKQSSQLTPLQKQHAHSFLLEVDQVKYAGKKPSLLEAEDYYQRLQDLIKDLKFW
jgi:hypothetical protein